jgi:hypothetical protein
LNTNSNKVDIQHFFDVLYFVHQESNRSYLLLILLAIVEEENKMKTLADLKVIHSTIDWTSASSHEFVERISTIILVKSSFPITTEIILDSFSSIKDNLSLPIKLMLENKDIFSENAKSELAKNLQYFKYCGVLLLHPYYTSLFDKYELLHDKLFTSLEAQIKAISFLYYVSTFEIQSTEQDLGVFKMIVGLPQNVFIKPDFELMEQEKEDCQSMLRQLIKDWSILKSTSEKTIQANFLQRGGTLKFEERTIDIHFEKSGFDVLLDHYPYNYSLIKLKWLDKLICIII